MNSIEILADISITQRKRREEGQDHTELILGQISLANFANDGLTEGFAAAEMIFVGEQR